MADHIKIRNAPGTWVVRAGGAVLGESSKALELTEGDYPSAIYFPPEDLGMAFLERTESSTRCPYKGTASYYTISSAEGEIIDGGWSYDNPIEAVARIKGYISFYTDRVSIEQL